MILEGFSKLDYFVIHSPRIIQWFVHAQANQMQMKKQRRVMKQCCNMKWWCLSCSEGLFFVPQISALGCHPHLSSAEVLLGQMFTSGHGETAAPCLSFLHLPPFCSCSGVLQRNQHFRRDWKHPVRSKHSVVPSRTNPVKRWGFLFKKLYRRVRHAQTSASLLFI